MSKKHTISSFKKPQKIDVVVGSIDITYSKEDVWDVASSPLKFAPHCINLDAFNTDSVLKTGSKIEETHSFLGWKQKYTGKIKSLIDTSEWSMYTEPVGWGPFPLPHFVKYSFASISSNKSNLSITCEYKAGGLLSLPIARTIVRKIMEQAVRKLLFVPERSLNQKS